MITGVMASAWPQGCFTGVLVGTGQGEAPTDVPCLGRRSTGACSAPCLGMAVTFPGKVSSCWALWQGVHIPMPMCTCVSLYCSWVHITTCTLKPACTHVHYPVRPVLR